MFGLLITLHTGRRLRSSIEDAWQGPSIRSEAMRGVGGWPASQVLEVRNRTRRDREGYVDPVPWR
jgi:hypothetical protein